MGLDNKNEIMTPAEFYKNRRPELFSDSEITTQATLPREHLSYELDKISTNQKQDEFETLCRRLAEKFIALNLIPQVGPTGGGDGKTDSETYPVSEYISDRWFTPENGWDKGENWAFAISAKKEWKGKAKSDVKKIVETKRGYTRVYFMSNQLIPSKKKKDVQDEFIKAFEIDVVILDGEWILEKIYGNNLINLVVDSLNLSSVYKDEVKLGSNDITRIEELEVLENKINNPVMYSEYDFQKVEDALESAILSRMLEKPRDEVEGKFDRALRFCKKTNNKRQLMRIYYQRAWTYINWYDDYPGFVEYFNKYKEYISEESTMVDIEDYFTLFLSLYNLSVIEICNLEEFNINIEIEKKDINNLLLIVKENKDRPTSSLMSRTHLAFLKSIYRENIKDIQNSFVDLSNILLESKPYLDYPFEATLKMIEEIGKSFPNLKEYDELIDTVAELSEKRNSELASGIIFLKRGIQKLEHNYNKESIVYLGKSVMKIAKEESQNFLYFTLLGLGMAYRNLGLIWVSNNCYISACHFSFKLSDEKGTLSAKTYIAVKEILTNELFIGRIPLILTWHEMFLLFHKNLQIDDSEEELPFINLVDGILSTRLIHTENTIDDKMKYLPDMLTNQALWLSQDTILYKQGYIDLCINEREDMTSENELDIYYKMVGNQPFVEQMLYDTNFMSEDNLSIYSNLLGCKFQINFPKDKEMLYVAETILPFFEGLMGTSLSSIHSHREEVVINIIENIDNDKMYFQYYDDTYEYDFYIKNTKIENHSRLLWDVIMKFSIDILGRNFLIDDFEQHFIKLFKKEAVHERLSLILGHRNSVLNILGDNPKLFFDNWIDYYKPSKYDMKRKAQVSFNYEKIIKDRTEKYRKEDMEEIPHNQVITHTIIDMPLWDKAKWKGFGFTFHPKEGIGVFLAFENSDSAKIIFQDWKNRIGDKDKDELISIVIIKGINKKNPCWYKVIVTINEKVLDLSQLEGLIRIPSRFHLMTPKDSINLNHISSGINHFKKYKLFPASMNKDGSVEPFFDEGIIKTSLIIKEAWEIGLNDLASVAIKEDDNPIIPNEHKDDAPVLDVLKELKQIK